MFGEPRRYNIFMDVRKIQKGRTKMIYIIFKLNFDPITGRVAMLPAYSNNTHIILIIIRLHIITWTYFAISTEIRIIIYLCL